MLDYVRRGYQPPRRLIVRSDSGHFHSRPLDSRAELAPGLIVYRFGADLFFANTNGFSSDLLELAAAPGVRWLCIDAGAISDVDYSGWKTLAELRHEIEARGVHLVVADLSHAARLELKRYGLLRQLDHDSVFDSVGEALEAYGASGDNDSDKNNDGDGDNDGVA